MKQINQTTQMLIFNLLSILAASIQRGTLRDVRGSPFRAAGRSLKKGWYIGDTRTSKINILLFLFAAIWTQSLNFSTHGELLVYTISSE